VKRGGPLNQRSEKRIKEDREREKAKAVVRQRARGGCEARGVFGRNWPDVPCRGPFDFHEVLTRARGGSISDPENILMVCRNHHDWITDHPIESAAVGLVRNSWDDPTLPLIEPAPPRRTPGTRIQAANVRPLPVARPATVGIIEVHETNPTTDLVRLTFVLPTRPWTLNGERKMTPYARADKVRQWKHDFKMLGTGSPKLQWANVEVFVHLRNRVEQDTVGSVPAYKAALDGLAGKDGAGVLPDDDGRYVRQVTFYPPENGTYDALEIILTGPPA
jgi:hypothetical protein